MVTDETTLLRDFGNRLMVEFDEMVLLYAELLEESRKDYSLHGEESRATGERKYAVLRQIEERTEPLRQDYAFFANRMSFPTGKMEWDLPFNEEYERVDIELDNMVIDRYFDDNIKKIYEDIRKQYDAAREIFFGAFAGISFVCPCCERFLFEANGGFEICGICKWENDKKQNNDPRFKGGANKDCLVDYRIRFRNRHVGY